MSSIDPYQRHDQPDSPGSADLFAPEFGRAIYRGYPPAGPQAPIPFETSPRSWAPDPAVVHAPPPEWTPGGRQARSRTRQLFVWLTRLFGAMITVSVSFLVLVILGFAGLGAADPGYHHDLTALEGVWLVSIGGGAFFSSFLGGLVARSRNRAEAAGLLGCAGVVAILGLSAHQSSGASRDVAIPGMLALLDLFVPLCLVIIGAALGARVVRRSAA